MCTIFWTNSVLFKSLNGSFGNKKKFMFKCCLCLHLVGVSRQYNLIFCLLVVLSFITSNNCNKDYLCRLGCLRIQEIVPFMAFYVFKAALEGTELVFTSRSLEVELSLFNHVLLYYLLFH